MSRKDDEIQLLKESIKELTARLTIKQDRIAELIAHNDRLTLTYEPYRLPGDPDNYVGYYDLKDENKKLRKSNKILRALLVSHD